MKDSGCSLVRAAFFLQTPLLYTRIHIPMNNVGTSKNVETFRGISIAIALMVFLLMVELFVYLALHNSVHKALDQAAMGRLNQLGQQVSLEFQGILKDLFYLTNLQDGAEYLEEPNEEDYQDINRFVTQMMSYQSKYDQVRLLDIHGNEVFRMNQDYQGNLSLTPQDDLQNKSSRYYVLKTLTLNPGEVYTSPFDLNIEQGVIEWPEKPMIRFSSLISNHNGELVGMAIINYLGQNLIDRLENQPKLDGVQWYLLNKEGYYIHYQDSSKEWGFMHPHSQHVGFFSDFPEAWGAWNDGNFIVDQGHNRFYFLQIDPIKDIISKEDVLPLILVFSKTDDTLHESDRIIYIGILLSTILIGPILFLMGLRLGKSRIKEKVYIQKIESLAVRDGMTGLFNRRAINEVLSRDVKLAQREGHNHSVGFIDINDLKLVNDKEGHDAGDVLINKAAEAIMRAIRQTDTAARIGGDEFLISFPHCSKKEAQKVMIRACKWFEEEGTKYTGKKWSMSMGTSEYIHNDDSLDDLIRRADEEMYKNKKEYKRKKK